MWVAGDVSLYGPSGFLETSAGSRWRGLFLSSLRCPFRVFGNCQLTTSQNVRIQGGGLLIQEAEQAETKLDLEVKAAQAVEEASRPLDVDLTTALAGPWIILQIRI